MSEADDVTVTPFTWRPDGYPCFVREDWHEEEWDKLDDDRKDVYIDRYTYLQEEYDEPDPDFAVLTSAILGGA